MDVAVIGGGISGLTAAWAAVSHAKNAGRDLEVTVFESEAVVGGKSQSVRHGQFLHEHGPVGFMSDEPALEAVIRDLDLSSELVVASETANHRYLVRDHGLVEIPANPLRFARSGILSRRGLMRMAAEPFIKKGSGADESVWRFAARRLGVEFADRLIGPMTLGIFAGDARMLSVQAAFPQMTKLESDHGSIIRGAIAQRRNKKKRGTFSSFANGLQSLSIRIAECGSFETRTHSRVVGLKRHKRDNTDGWLLQLDGDGEPVFARAVVIASEAWATAQFVGGLRPGLADVLSEIEFPPAAVVALGFSGPDADRVPAGFGALIPRVEGIRTLGVTWDSRMFPGRCQPNQVLIRAIMGGTFDPAVATMSVEELSAAATADLTRIFGFSGPPDHQSVKVWPRAIPQYGLGHPAIVAAVEGHLRELPNLHMAGNSLYGTSFGKSADAGMRAGTAAAQGLLAGG